MRDRTIKAQAEAKQHFDTYIREQAHGGGGSAADELHKLNELKEKGALSGEEFEKAKAKILVYGAGRPLYAGGRIPPIAGVLQAKLQVISNS